jgi:CDP-diacylglycerol--glycerol-3-phosphate 3-phosphatidyltransferase
MKLNLPNQLTIARLILAVLFFVLLAQYNHRDPARPIWMLDVATAVFIVAAVTDFLDGYLARSRGLVTALGRILDPLADKVLICGAFILFLGAGFVDEQGHNVTEVRPWMVVVIVARELLVTGLRGFNEARGKAFPAMIHGKIKMWMQSIAAPAVMLLVAHGAALMAPRTAAGIMQAVVWVTVVFTALSAGQYLARSRDILDGAA